MCVLAAAQHFPAAAQHFPAAAQHFPAAAQHFPAAAQHFPIIAIVSRRSLAESVRSGKGSNRGSRGENDDCEGIYLSFRGWVSSYAVAGLCGDSIGCLCGASVGPPRNDQLAYSTVNYVLPQCQWKFAHPLAPPSPKLHENPPPLLSTLLIKTMASERSQRSSSRRCEEEDRRNPQQSGSLRNDTTTPPDVETLARFPITPDLPSPRTPNATSTKRASSAPPTSCAVSAYRYSPLPEGCIRLLRLLPHRDEHAPVQGQLFDYPLLDSGKGTHLYEALSYVWGSSEKPQSLSTDKGYIPVTTNLHMALKRLRDCSLDRIVWVDAVCIDQGNTEERNHQVQSMAKIYAKACRVVVWLEEATAASGQVHGEAITDSDRALEALRIAADGQPTKSIDSETNRQAILTLLQRSWFQRIWVLQEVAAARHVLIMCRSTEIEGFAFCSGLNVLKLASQNSAIQSRIRSAAFLIKSAIFRSKYATSRSDRFSLGIRPLGELVDMYHNREATDRRDKVYALLGMSSDDHIPAGLSPDYGILWKDLFHRLLKSLIGEQASVETWEEMEIAVIKSKGCILGEVSTVESGGGWNDRPSVDITSKNTPGYLGEKKEWRGRWTLHASAKSILKGDVICLLQGASKPTIIRLYEDYCAVIAIAVTPTDDKRTEGVNIDWTDQLRSITIFPHEFLLVWDWEKSWRKLENEEEYECFINSRVPKHAMTALENDLDKATRLQNTGLVFRDLEKYEEAAKNLRKAIEACERISGREHPHTLGAMDNLALLYRDQGNLKQAEKLGLMADIIGRRGDYTHITEGGLIRIAGSFDKEMMDLLLNRGGDEIEITEGVVKAAAGNHGDGEGLMMLLLDRKEDEVKIREEAVIQIAESFGREMMLLLLNRKRDEIRVTEEMVKAAAGCRNGKEVMMLLLDRKSEEIRITEEVVKAAAGNRYGGAEVMRLLLNRKGNEIRITEEVVKAAAGNGNGKKVMELLLDRKRDEIRITEEVVKAAAGNQWGGAEVIRLLLDRRGVEVKITDEAVVQIARSFGEELLKLLPKRGGSGS
ncbi:hypothetical protein DL771_009488 [Monosporascus sp. 5C6A]|nr:hypothetical protein DL771_009488 [Monosporascus sp. 5C6A]